MVGGYYHSFAISRSGKLFSWACGNFGGLNDGQLGHTDFREGTDPEEVTLPSMAASETVVDARAGCYHSAVLTSAGRVFSFGLNNYGQLGRSGLKRSDPVPRYIQRCISISPFSRRYPGTLFRSLRISFSLNLPNDHCSVLHMCCCCYCR